MSGMRWVAELITPNGRLIRWLRPLRERALGWWYGRTGLVRPINGVPFRVLPQYRASFVANHDQEVAAYFRPRVRAGHVCFSVGANVGVYALQFAHWAGPTGRVFAFEPNPQAAVILRRHLALNGLTDRVLVVELALADRTGTAAFHTAGIDPMARLGTPNPDAGESYEVTVEVDTLDAFCRLQGVQPDHIMMDIEGFEGSALAGAREVFTAGPPTVVVEMHPSYWAAAGTDRAGLAGVLAVLGVTAVPLCGQADPLGAHSHVALERLPT